ncbi:MAG: glutathione S-transferase family protein [Gammaproteobacteria bacterium]|nr:glutathione S-transferase family protein [Gammaproteobacteria bacterium]
MFKLYGVPLSPFARKALLVLDYKELKYENLPTFPGDASSEFRKISPLGKIPVLDHDGFTIPDTSVICRYLDRIAPQKPIYPTDPKLEAKALWLEEYADSRLVETCAALFRERLLKPKMMQQPTDEAAVQNILENTMPECLAYLESVVPESGYLVGDSLSIADVAVVTCFIQARYGDFDVDGKRAPKLRRYLDQAFAAPLVVKRLAAEQGGHAAGLGLVRARDCQSGAGVRRGTAGARCRLRGEREVRRQPARDR